MFGQKDNTTDFLHTAWRYQNDKGYNTSMVNASQWCHVDMKSIILCDLQHFIAHRKHVHEYSFLCASKTLGNFDDHKYSKPLVPPGVISSKMLQEP